jgi:hypothetical protein
MAKIYTDTNVLRYFGTAFGETGLTADLRDQLLLSPLSVMELLSQLGTDGAEEAFAAVQAFLRVYNPEASGMLPWSDDTFRMCLFALPPGEDVITPSLNNAVVRALNASEPGDLKADAEELRTLMDASKDQTAKQFSDVLNRWRSEGPLPEEEHRAIFARSIARRAGVDETTVDVDFIVKHLNALYVFESTKMQVAAKSHEYNVDKHSNDVYDAELLIYLADPSLHLLTADKGFRRIEKSSQQDRVHIAAADCLKDPACAERTIRGIVGPLLNNGVA